MKKIIKGKLYNTDTATEIGNWHNKLPMSDFCYCEETLYQTKKGVYFLVGRGGAMSRYSKTVGNMTAGTVEFIPMTEQEAFSWASGSIDPEIVQNVFGHLIEEA